MAEICLGVFVTVFAQGYQTVLMAKVIEIRIRFDENITHATRLIYTTVMLPRLIKITEKAI